MIKIIQEEWLIDEYPIIFLILLKENKEKEEIKEEIIKIIKFI